MFTHKVSSEDFEKIRNGKKCYVFFINKDCDMFIDDYILFKKLPNLFDGQLVKIIDKKTFTSFCEMATVMSLEQLGFEGVNKEDVVKFCDENFDKDLESQYGVVVYKFELTD